MEHNCRDFNIENVNNGQTVENADVTNVNEVFYMNALQNKTGFQG